MRNSNDKGKVALLSIVLCAFMSEIELKFVTHEGAHQTFKERVLPLFKQHNVTVHSYHEMRLENDYYDTAEQDFQARKMGFRVRGNNGQYEQTLKTNGKVSGGLHQRAEYNVPLDSPEPDLTLFDKTVWPEDWNLGAINNTLVKQFSTHFTRYEYLVEINDSTVEIVIDTGFAKTDKASSKINEIELELKKGNLSAVFTLAGYINASMDVRLSDVSKAAQGYQLLHGFNAKIEPLPDFLPLDARITTEDAFSNAVQVALTHWQHHEHLYFESGSIKMLAEVSKSVQLLLQSVSLYLPVLQCPELLSLHKKLIVYARRWIWQDDLQSLRYLLSKKSLFHKTLSKHPAIVSYLQGRKAGLLHAHNPTNLFFDSAATDIKLNAIDIINAKPWQEIANGYELPVIEHAKGWMSQGWQTVQQSMPEDKPMGPANYSAVEVMLRQALWGGFLLGDLFVEERGNFRAPWLDLLTGIDELNALLMLRQAIQDAELETQDELSKWTSEKLSILIKVMERTRRVALRKEIYW